MELGTSFEVSEGREEEGEGERGGRGKGEQRTCGEGHFNIVLS